MVFAINAPEEGERTFNAFKEKAKAAKHPNPADRETADFTPPGAPGVAPPAGTDTPPAASGSAAPTDSISGSAPVSSSVGSASLDSATLAPVAAQSSPTVLASADQAMIAPLAPTTRSGALSAAQLPGAGIALTLAGLLAGMLL